MLDAGRISLLWWSMKYALSRVSGEVQGRQRAGPSRNHASQRLVRSSAAAVLSLSLGIAVNSMQFSIFRFVAKYVFGYDGTINRYLDALEADVVAATGPCAGSPPTPLAQKLGIKPGHIVGTFHAPAHVPDLLDDLPDGARIEAEPMEGQALDVALLFVTDTASLNAEFSTIKSRLQPDGGLWVAWPKRNSTLATDLDRDRVRNIGLGHRLVDNKVCAIDEDWSGLRFVRRLEDR